MKITKKENLMVKWSREVVDAGYACDLPNKYLPNRLRWSIWSKKNRK